MGIEIQAMQLEDLHGLEKLERIAGGLAIKDNPNLIDISAAYETKLNGITLEISGNAKLDQCKALEAPMHFPEFESIDIRIERNMGPDAPMCRL